MIVQKEPLVGWETDKGIFQWGNNLIAVKFGTDLVFQEGTGINLTFLESIAKQTVSLRVKGINSILVGSGAIAVGEGDAYKGQTLLLENWRRVFGESEIGELLLTGRQLRSRAFIRNYILERIFAGRTMLVNGDDNINKGRGQNAQIASNNDLLAGYISQVTGAKRLFLLTNVDGVYDKDGRVIKLISDQEQIDRDVVFEGRSKRGRGGMEVKVRSALNFVQSGFDKVAFIANGNEQDVVERIMVGEDIGTKIC